MANVLLRNEHTRQLRTESASACDSWEMSWNSAMQNESNGTECMWEEEEAGKKRNTVKNGLIYH